MSIAVCPGSFDPVTNGHLDIFRRVAAQFDEVIVTVMINKNKKGMFNTEERMALIADATSELPNVRVDSWEGLLVHYAQQHDVTAIVKGLRGANDFDYELQMAQMNQELTGIDTFFVPAHPQFGFLSSSLVKEVAAFGGDVTSMLPATVHDKLMARLTQ